MKKYLTVVLLLAAFTASAQPRPMGQRDRIKSEKIAFITNSLQLTPEEAQLFWPIYNQYNDAVEKAHIETMKALFALTEAYGRENVTEKDIEPLLEAYNGACRREAEVTSRIPDYSKAISKFKTGKLYVCEEQFRMRMVHMLGTMGQKMMQAPSAKN